MSTSVGDRSFSNAATRATGGPPAVSIPAVAMNGASREGSAIGTVNALRFFNLVGPDLDEEVAQIDEIGTVRANNNYPLGWAMAGNTPLRWYKGNAHGGGVRDPLVMHWPSRIRDGGALRRQFQHVQDICPTILDAIGIEAPSEVRGVS